jgi:hypothetical protein
MKWIKTFESISEIERLCNEYGIENWTINNEGLVDVDGSVDLSNKRLAKIPINFGRVEGDFYCDFYCPNNGLTTLKGAPREVGGYFHCGYNQLTTLEGAPSRVGGDFSCSSNQLTTLEGAPREVGGDFYCHNNGLTTLEWAPNRVGGGFSCHDNQLWTFRGAPEFIEGNFHCSGNKISEIWDLFRIPKYIDWLNDHDAIRMNENNQPYVILDRLNSFLEDIGKEPVGELKNYRTI